MESTHKWSTDIESGFRKLELIYKTSLKKEIEQFDKWQEEFKMCPKCKNKLPKNTYFFASGGSKNGIVKFHGHCKICEGSPKYGWGRIYNNELNKNGYHYCSICDRILPLNNLYFAKSNSRSLKTGFASNCKECLGSGFGISSINNFVNDLKDGFKVCHVCLLELPNKDEYFFKKEYRDNGSCVCKKCKGFDYLIQKTISSTALDEDEIVKNSIKIIKDFYSKFGRSPSKKEYHNIRQIGIEYSLENLMKIMNVSSYEVMCLNLNCKPNKHIGKITLDLNMEKCKSITERDITNYFIKSNIDYKKEIGYSDVIESDKTKRRFDWSIIINNKTYYIEYFGMFRKGYERHHIYRRYMKKFKKKIKDIYKSGNIDKCIFIFPNDIKYKTENELNKKLNLIFSYYSNLEQRISDCNE